MANTIPFAALVPVTPVFTNTERLALAGFLTGYSGLTRQAYELDLRQYAAWCQQHQLRLFAARRADIECFARDLETRGRSRATITRRLCTIAGFYEYAVEGQADQRTERDHHAAREPPNLKPDSGCLRCNRRESWGHLVSTRPRGSLGRVVAGLHRVESRDQVDGEVVRRPTVNAVRYCERKVVRAWDEERLDDILHEAVVLDRTARPRFPAAPCIRHHRRTSRPG